MIKDFLGERLCRNMREEAQDLFRSESASNFLHACILPSGDVHVSLKTLCSASGAASSTTASLFRAMGRVLTRRVFMRWSSTVRQPLMWAVAR